jgi:hypothetical protein
VVAIPPRCCRPIPMLHDAHPPRVRHEYPMISPRSRATAGSHSLSPAVRPSSEQLASRVGQSEAGHCRDWLWRGRESFSSYASPPPFSQLPSPTRIRIICLPDSRRNQNQATCSVFTGATGGLEHGFQTTGRPPSTRKDLFKSQQVLHKTEKGQKERKLEAACQPSATAFLPPPHGSFAHPHGATAAAAAALTTTGPDRIAFSQPPDPAPRLVGPTRSLPAPPPQPTENHHHGPVSVCFRGFRTRRHDERTQPRSPFCDFATRSSSVCVVGVPRTRAHRKVFGGGYPVFHAFLAYTLRGRGSKLTHIRRVSLPRRRGSVRPSLEIKNLPFQKKEHTLSIR